MSIAFVLYDRKELLQKNKTVILASSWNKEEILDIQQNEFPNATLHSFENKGITIYKRIGRIKCNRCGKEILVVDTILPPAFPFCRKICQLIDLANMVDDKEPKKDKNDYSSIE